MLFYNKRNYNRPPFYDTTLRKYHRQLNISINLYTHEFPTNVRNTLLLTRVTDDTTNDTYLPILKKKIPFPKTTPLSHPPNA